MSIAPEAVQTVGLFSGQHVLAEIDGIDAALLDDEVFLCQILDDALKRAGATVLQVISKQFDPQGVTVLALLSESHASLHTYPEIGSVFVDVFTCGTKAQPEVAVGLLAEAMGASTVQSRTIRRGLENQNEMKVTP
ncbi:MULTISPECIES: adenosylmethionine decarboxylase [unclassified Crossiella]|uniref:adenosylmethionine decarboxylase n=1 Tax=unclassified Crossiella TaxID=2620835 RepID=UPI001FFEFACC|nr:MULTISPECIES: adenosylmethionine decarboxylase [unclassified Crossiella]MCK2242731.1 adenosylmethionine decarboxylase [Crossiella sp. S99.2]MCK2256608.1 adenosylmethionine decarboxylase [Crossiella sp. S99.1]